MQMWHTFWFRRYCRTVSETLRLEPPEFGKYVWFRQKSAQPGPNTLSIFRLAADSEFQTKHKKLVAYHLCWAYTPQILNPSAVLPPD